MGLLKKISRKIRRKQDVPTHQVAPEGWARERVDAKVKGWNVASVVEAQRAWLDKYHDTLHGPAPLGVGRADGRFSTGDVASHNTAVAFAYVAALAARESGRMSLLDWGGGVGQYALLAQAALPGVTIDYHCKDVPVQCEQGRKLLPNASFYTNDDEFTGRRFDLVLASGALTYVEDWRSVLTRLAAATGRYLYVTRLPIVLHCDSYVLVQRAYAVGYDTEFLAWALNRSEFVEFATSLGLRLVREFLLGEEAEVTGAAEGYQARGYLFERAG